MDGLAPTSGEPGKAESMPKQTPVKTTITIDGKSYDLAEAFPINLGDWEKLDKMGVMERSPCLA